MATMDEGRTQALGANHQELRSGLIVENILPALRPYLTAIEYLRVENKPGNVAQVDELVKILLTKENRHFDGFCRVCERDGYPHWAKRLRAVAGCRKQEVEDSDLMEEKDCFYYVDIEKLDDKFYRGLLKSLDRFVLESTDASFQCFRREAERAIRHSRHVTGSKVRLSNIRTEFLDEIQDKYALWDSNLEYRLLREVIIGCEDEGLMKQLQEYEDLLRAKGETIIYHCKKQKQLNNDLYMKLKAKHETTVATLMRMQDFLVNDVGLDDAIFTGFREGCIELYFKLSPETASISMGPLRSNASRLKLLSLGVSKVELSGHWVIDTNSGRVTHLKTLQNDCFTEDSDSDMSADERQQHEGGLSKETTQECPSVKRLPLWDWELCPPSKRAKLYSQDEDFPSAVPSDAMQCRPVKNSHVDCLAQDRASDVSASEEGVCSGSCHSDGATSEKSPVYLVSLPSLVAYSGTLADEDTSCTASRTHASMASAKSLFTVVLLGSPSFGKSIIRNKLVNAVTDDNPNGSRRIKQVYTSLLDEWYTRQQPRHHQKITRLAPSFHPGVATSLSDRPTLSDIESLAVPHVAAMWYHLGIALDVKPFVLESIVHEQERANQPRELFAKWLLRSPGTGNLARTWQSIVDAVCIICGAEAAEKIRKAVLPSWHLTTGAGQGSGQSSSQVGARGAAVTCGQFSCQAGAQAKGSAAWRKQRRSKSTISGTILLERTSQHLYLPSYSAELKDEAMALVDPPSVARRASTTLCVPARNPSSRVTDNSAVMPNSSVCDDEQRTEIVQDLNVLEEPPPISGDHVPTDQVERIGCKAELLQLQFEEDEAPACKVCMQQNSDSMDQRSSNGNFQNSQSDDAST